MTGTRALLAAVLVSCGAATLGGAFAWRRLRAEGRLRERLLGRYGPEISLLEDLSMKLSGGASGLSSNDRSAGYRAFAQRGILVARVLGGFSPDTFHVDGRVAPLSGKLLEAARERMAVKRCSLELRAGGTVAAVAAAWKVRAGPSCDEVVCEFAVEADALSGTPAPAPRRGRPFPRPSS